jgi:hypothetical protein
MVIIIIHIHDHIVVRFTSTYAISAYHRKGCELNYHTWRSVLNTAFIT